ncbi:MAG: hypothetical protein JJU29_06240 [Verrucomicrobia bacterium]|nr:hypothetical protein [Verrucomicrobiota bacterium]MCH8511467.1 hypothetical protein [Kiritimatiellia bacterium]
MKRLILAAFLLSACMVTAQVFWRRPVAHNAWQRGYQAPVRLQEGSGDTSLYAVKGSLHQIRTELENKHGRNFAWMGGENVAWGLAVENGRVHRYLVQPRPEADEWWVLHVDQRQRDAGRPGRKPQKHQLTDIPAFPNSTPTFYTRDEDNLLAVEVSRTPVPPDAVLDQLSGSLQADGWVASPTNTGGMRMFIQRDQMAVLSAKSGKDGYTSVVRMHKPLGVE